MKKLYILVVLISGISLTACIQKADRGEKDFKVVLPDTSKSCWPKVLYDQKKKRARELLLEDIDNGSKMFELRLWAKTEILNDGQVYVIKLSKQGFICLRYWYLEKENDVIDNKGQWTFDVTIDTFGIKKIKPKSGWKSFFEKINKENIFNLPSQSDIKGWKNIVSDGLTFYIEYATKNKYKFYYYNCPDIYEDKFSECKHMTNILDVFNKELGLSLGWEKYGGHPYRCR